MADPLHGTGIYFDGVSARRQTVNVDFETDAIAIAAPDGGAIARWPYADVVRLPAPGHRLRLGLAGDGPPARLGIPDPAFAEAAKERLGVLTLQVEAKERHRRHRVLEWTIAAVAALLFLGVVGMPSLAEMLLPLVPASTEQSVGDNLDGLFRAQFTGPPPFECGVGENEKQGHAAFLKMMGTLEAAAALPVRLHPVVVRDAKTINAQAGPGGYVYVYDGIIRFADSPDELAGILAHELGHVAHRDAMRASLHDAGISYLFGVVLGDFFGSNVAMFVAANQVLGARHTRREEAAADAYAVALLRKIGADPHALALGFQHMLRLGYAGSAALLADHPTNQQRIDAVMATPASPVTAPPFLTADEWQALKRVCADTKPDAKPVAMK